MTYVKSLLWFYNIGIRCSLFHLRENPIMKIQALRRITPCRLINNFQSFKEASKIVRPSGWKQHVHPKCWWVFISRQD
jgi:hypothetical protein